MRYIDTVRMLLPEEIQKQYMEHVRECVHSVFVSDRCNHCEKTLWYEMDKLLLDSIYSRIKSRLTWVKMYYTNYENIFVQSGLFWSELARKFGVEVWGFVELSDEEVKDNA